MSGDRTGSIVAWVVAMNCLSASIVSLRFYVRAKLLRSVKSEDWCMLVSMLSCLVFGVFSVLESQNGLGRHMIDVSEEEFMTYLKWSWIGTIWYNLSLCFTKLSVLLLYLRVLTYDYIRKTTWTVLAIVAIYNTWAMGMYLTTCIPVEKAWNKKLEGYCHPQTVWWALTYLHIITDFLIFLIPVPVVMTMTVPLRRKIGLLALFTFGLFVCLISVVRAIMVNKLLWSPDHTWDLATLVNWSTIETSAAVVCGCIPTLRPLLVKVIGPLADRLFPRQQQSLEDPESARPRTIGSLSWNALRFGRQPRTKSAAACAPVDSDLSWADGTTLILTRVESKKISKPQTTVTDSDAELTIRVPDHAADSINEELRPPPKVYAKRVGS